MAYTEIKSSDFIVDREYIQSDFNAHMGTVARGRLHYKGKSKDNHVFENINGEVFYLTENDLKANPMLANTVTVREARDKMREKRAEKYGGKYNHDPYELVRMAHAYTYGRKPNHGSVLAVETEETNDLLAYRANVQGQDCTLYIGKRQNGMPDYTNYAYGMSFRTGVEPEDVRIGSKYYVDNRVLRCVDVTDFDIQFEPTRGKDRSRVFVSKDHVRAFHNIQKTERKQGEMAENDTIGEPSLSDGKLMQIFAEVETDTSYTPTVQQKPKAHSLYVKATSELNQRTAEMLKAYKGISGKDNPMRYKKLMPGKTYLTPYGHQEAIAILKYETAKKDECKQTLLAIAKTGDYYTADKYKSRNRVLQFGNRYYTLSDVQEGIILEPLVAGKEYITPNGVETYVGQTVTSKQLEMDTDDAMRANAKYVDFAVLNNCKDFAKMSVQFSGLSRPYKEAVMDLIQKPVYQFSENTYSFMAFAGGYIYPKEADKKVQKQREKTRKDQHMTSVINQVSSVTEDEVGKDNTGLKVSYKRLAVGAPYMTAYGRAMYMKKGKKDGKVVYEFQNEQGRLFLLSVQNLVDGYVWRDMPIGSEYFCKDRLLVYAGYEVYDTGLVAFHFQDKKTGEDVTCSAKMFLNRQVHAVKGGK